MVTVINDARDAVRDRMEVLAFHLSNHMERIQIQASSLATSTNQRIYNFYEALLEWLESQNVAGRLQQISSSISEQGQEFIVFIRSGINFNQHFNNAKAFLIGNEVTKQAIYFGFAGLVTGSVIGLCIGYSFKGSGSSSISSPISDTSSDQLNKLNNGSGRSNSRMMKAIICFSPRNGIDGITQSSIPIPTITQPDHVLIQVRATGIDNIDARIANGYGRLLRQYFGMSSGSRRATAFILGRECSGIVIDVGSRVTNFDINDRVWLCLPMWSIQGIMSEYIVVPEKYVAHKPKNISFEGAAVLPYASITVWHKVIEQAHLEPTIIKSKRILIHLGSASSKNDCVGLIATQILKSWGGRITISTQEEGSSSPNSFDDDSDMIENDDSGSNNSNSETDEQSFSISRSTRSHNISSSVQMTFLHTLKSLGAESHIIIPNDESLLPDLTQRIFDVVINTDSPELTPLLQKFAKDPGGNVIETFPLKLESSSCSLWKRFVPSFFYRKESLDETLDTSLLLTEVKRLVETGQIVPVVAKSFLPNQYDQAFRHVSNLTRSALVQAHVGKSVIVFKVS